MIAKPSGMSGASSIAGAWASSFFANHQAISSLTSRGNQPMFFPGPGIVVEIISDSRAPPGSICPYKENEPFAVQ